MAYFHINFHGIHREILINSSGMNLKREIISIIWIIGTISKGFFKMLNCCFADRFVSEFFGYSNWTKSNYTKYLSKLFYSLIIIVIR